jgi:hypothetical protein
LNDRIVRKAERPDDHADHDRREDPAAPLGFHAPRHRWLDQADRGGPRGESQQHEEQRAEQVSAGHVAERQGERLEDQARARTRIEAVGEHDREDRQAGQQRHPGVRDHHGERRCW